MVDLNNSFLLAWLGVVARIAERVPCWVERLLIPTMESRDRVIVKDEVGRLEKLVEARFEGMSRLLDARLDAVNVKVDSLEKRLPVVQDLAEIKVRLAELEKKAASR